MIVIGRTKAARKRSWFCSYVRGPVGNHSVTENASPIEAIDATRPEKKDVLKDGRKSFRVVLRVNPVRM